MERWEQAFDGLENPDRPIKLTPELNKLMSEAAGILEDALLDVIDQEVKSIENEQDREKQRGSLEEKYIKRDLNTLDLCFRVLSGPMETDPEKIPPKKGKGFKGMFVNTEGRWSYNSFPAALSMIKKTINNALANIEIHSPEKRQQIEKELNELDVVKQLAARAEEKAALKGGDNVKQPVSGEQLIAEQKKEDEDLIRARERQAEYDRHRRERAKKLKEQNTRVRLGGVENEGIQSIKNEDIHMRRSVVEDREGNRPYVYEPPRNANAPERPKEDDAAPLPVPHTGIVIDPEAPDRDMMLNVGIPFELNEFIPYKSEENQDLFRRSMSGQTDRKDTVQSNFIRWLVGAKGMKLTDIPGLNGLSPSEKQTLGSEYLTFLKEHPMFTARSQKELAPGALESAKEYARINRAFAKEVFRVTDPMIGGDIQDPEWRREHVTPMRQFLAVQMINRDQSEQYLESMEYPELHNAYQDEYGENALSDDVSRLNMVQKFMEVAQQADDPNESEISRKASNELLKSWKDRLGTTPASKADPVLAAQIFEERGQLTNTVVIANAEAAMGQAPKSAGELVDQVIAEGAKGVRDAAPMSWKQKGAAGIRETLQYAGNYSDRVFEQAGFLFSNAGRENSLPFENLTREQLDRIHFVFGHTVGQLASPAQRQVLSAAGADFRDGFFIDGQPVTEVFREKLEGKDEKTRKEFLETEIIRAVFDPARKVEYRPYVLDDKMSPVPADQKITIETPVKLLKKHAETGPIDLETVKKIRTTEDAKAFLEKLSNRWGECVNRAGDFSNNPEDLEKARQIQAVLKDLVKNFDNTVGAGAAPVSFRDALGMTTTHKYLSDAGRQALINTVRVANEELFGMQDRDFARAFAEGTVAAYGDNNGLQKQVPGIRELTDQDAPVSAGSMMGEMVSAENVQMLSRVYSDLITHDPKLHWNSSEYRKMRDSLKVIHDWVTNKEKPYDPENQDDRNRMMGLCSDAFTKSEAYIRKRGMKGVVQDYGIARRNDALVVMDVLNPQYMKSFSAELPQLSFEGRRMSYTELQHTVKEHITERFGSGNGEQADNAARKAEESKKTANNHRKNLRKLVDNLTKQAQDLQEEGLKAADDPEEKFRKKVERTRKIRQSEYLEELVLKHISEEDLLDVVDKKVTDRDVYDELFKAHMEAKPGAGKEAMMSIFAPWFYSREQSEKDAIIKEAVNRLPGPVAGQIIQTAGDNYKDGLSEGVLRQAQRTHTNKLAHLINSANQRQDLRPEEKARITTALVNVNRHLNDAPTEQRFFRLRQEVARNLSELEKTTSRRLGNQVMDRPQNKIFKNSLKDHMLAGKGKAWTTAIRPEKEAEAQQYFNQKFSLSDGFKGTLKDMLETMDKAGMLVRNESGGIDAFKGLADAQKKLKNELNAENPDLMKVTEASEAFEKQRALYKDLYGKIGAGFSKDDLSGVTNEDVRRGIPWEFGADIKKSSTLSAMCELGVMLKEKNISVDQFLADPAKVMQDIYREEGEKHKLENLTEGKSPMANLAGMLTQSGQTQRMLSRARDASRDLPKFASLLTYGEPEQERFTHNQMVNRMVGVDAKEVLYENDLKAADIIDTTVALYNEDKKRIAREEQAAIKKEASRHKRNPGSPHRNVRTVNERKQELDLSDEPGTLQQFNNTFRTLAVIDQKDFDARSMMYMAPAGKDGREQKPFSLEEYIRDHKFDYAELKKRQSELLKEYLKEAAKGNNRSDLPPLEAVVLKMQEGLAMVVNQKREEVKNADPQTKKAFKELENMAMDSSGVYTYMRNMLLKEDPKAYKAVFGDPRFDEKLSPAAENKAADLKKSIVDSKNRSLRNNNVNIMNEEPPKKGKGKH